MAVGTPAAETRAVAVRARFPIRAVVTRVVATRAAETRAVAVRARLLIRAVATRVAATRAAETRVVAVRAKFPIRAVETRVVATRAVATRVVETRAVATRVVATPAVGTRAAGIARRIGPTCRSGCPRNSPQSTTEPPTTLFVRAIRSRLRMWATIGIWRPAAERRLTIVVPALAKRGSVVRRLRAERKVRSRGLIGEGKMALERRKFLKQEGKRLPGDRAGRPSHLSQPGQPGGKR